MKNKWHLFYRLNIKWCKDLNAREGIKDLHLDSDLLSLSIFKGLRQNNKQDFSEVSAVIFISASNRVFSLINKDSELLLREDVFT